MQISNGGVVTGMFAAGLGLGYNSGSGTLSVSSGSQFYGGIAGDMAQGSGNTAAVKVDGPGSSAYLGVMTIGGGTLTFAVTNGGTLSTGTDFVLAGATSLSA